MMNSLMSVGLAWDAGAAGAGEPLGAPNDINPSNRARKFLIFKIRSVVPVPVSRLESVRPPGGSGGAGRRGLEHFAPRRGCVVKGCA